MNQLCELLGIQIPILQAPTASIAGPELAAAVSSAGALGGMGLTWTALDEAVRSVLSVRASGRPFCVNYALAFQPRSLPQVLDAGAPIVTFSWGDAAQHIPAVHAAGALAGVQVGNVAGAMYAAQAGADFVICQGVEAGGHVQSSTALHDLLGGVIAAIAGRVPVVAAGGLATGANIARVMSVGASGVMLGTRFVATRESRAHAHYKERLVAASEGETALTVCFEGGWPGAPMRVLRNATLDLWEAAGCPAAGTRPGEGEIVAWSQSGEAILRYEDTGAREGMTGDIDAMALYAGTGVGEVGDLPAAGELVRRLWADALPQAELN